MDVETKLNIEHWQLKLEDEIKYITSIENNYTYILTQKNFLVYLYGEHDAQGRSWCPDCEIAQPFVEKILPKIIDKESK